MNDSGTRLGPDRLHGRTAELERIRRFLADATAGHGRLLVIDGPRGIGKSRLLHEGLALGRTEPGRPIVIGTDDVDSAALLSPTGWAAAASGGRAPLSAVLESHPDAATSERSGRASGAYDRIVRLSLGPLDAAATARVVADVLGAAPEPDLLSHIDRAGGNPRLIVDLAAGLREQDLLEIRSGRVGLRTAALPERVIATVRSWLRDHSERCRQLLHTGAVLGPTFGLPDALELLGETTVGVLPALTEALAAGLLVSDHDQLGFANDIVREAIRAQLPISAQVSMLHDVRRMRERPADHARPPRTSPLRSVHTELDRNIHAVAAVRNLVAAGRLDAAITLARSTLERPLPEELVVELRCLLSDVLVMAGRAAEGVAEAERVLEATDTPSAHAAAVSGAALLFGQYMLDATGARSRAHAVLGRRGLVGKDPHAVIAATVLSNDQWAQGNMRDGLRWGRAAARGVDPDLPYAWPKLALATKLAELRRFEESEAMIADAAAHIDRLELGAHLSAISTIRARMLVQAGRLAEARDEALTALDVAAELGTPLLVPLTLTVLALVALRSGDAEAAAGYVRRYRDELAGCRTLFRSAQYDWAELLVTRARDGVGAAAEFLTGTARGLETNRALLVQEPGAPAFFVRLAQLIGDDDLAARSVAAVDRLAADNPEFPHIAVAARHARGLLEGDRQALGAAIADHVDLWARACAERHLYELDSPPAKVAPIRTAAARADDGASGWHTLTETERSIAELVGAGLTNRQVAKRIYVSPHTVNYHLRAIFRKLGVSSRIELVHHLYRRAT
ncbi:LuxR C-terminal-related transcriptional regulator [Nocardia sp. CDC159]|uniref:LuxR C-terminal-related transcriptional regulator n=1 Tax=Nocardia pulmonis TaxID=2951408 RepID=A0A9X2J1N7_9NOCA|nr:MULTISPECIES: LuxR family transcriptional regulator [Nocardia]MCM6779064.1 LuxR C-terminal-related transcriptional regulator [Nocardia pulmonis]MCM6791954.1 LuxR C-terminal-related transcriptional regulator [Nocardia sp. CDC159]